MDLIFLDFDGVITTLESGWEPEPSRMDMIRTLCGMCGARIVITSSWRHGNLRDTLQSLSGHDYTLGDMTAGVTDKHGPMRGDEIARYLDAHPEHGGYVIFDDDSDMLPCQLPRFIHTHTYTGLQVPDCLEAIRLLTGRGRDMGYDDGAYRMAYEKDMFRRIGERLAKSKMGTD